MGCPVTDLLMLVDENDNSVGYEEKEACHLLPAKLHRAFSVFIFNSSGKMLIHRRSSLKKTWPGFWTNACCSHPRKGESIEEATVRRLIEELGFQAPLTYLFTFRYAADYDAKYGESEIDHVFLGFYDGKITPNPDEIEDWKLLDPEILKAEVESSPESYTPWFRRALPEVLRRLQDFHSSGTMKEIDTGP